MFCLLEFPMNWALKLGIQGIQNSIIMPKTSRNPMHILLPAKKIIAFTTFSWVGKLLPCTVSGPECTLIPHPPVSLILSRSYTLRQALLSPAWTIPIACCTVSLVQGLLPSVHSFQHARGYYFSIVKNVQSLLIT